MARVFIVSNNGYNFDKAKDYGDLVYLTTGFVDVHKDLADIEDRLTNILKDVKDEDYLLLVGINLLCVLTYKIISENLNHAPINILHWNDNLRSYVKYQI